MKKCDLALRRTCMSPITENKSFMQTICGYKKQKCLNK